MTQSGVAVDCVLVMASVSVHSLRSLPPRPPPRHRHLLNTSYFHNMPPSDQTNVPSDHPTPATGPTPHDGHSETASEEQKVHERYTTGDVEIVSSDGVCFRVNPAFLIAGR